jgi:hypothetical protein
VNMKAPWQYPADTPWHQFFIACGDTASATSCYGLSIPATSRRAVATDAK